MVILRGWVFLMSEVPLYRHTGGEGGDRAGGLPRRAGRRGPKGLQGTLYSIRTFTIYCTLYTLYCILYTTSLYYVL